MPVFKKTILKLDAYKSPDGLLPSDAENIQHWADTFATMKERQIRVPISWGHAKDIETHSKPLNAAEWAETAAAKQTPAKDRRPEDVIGNVVGFSVSEDGNAIDLELDVPLEADAERVEADLVEVSPVIFKDWKDGQDNKYKNCVTHVDLVHHPVDNAQTPFQAASFRMATDDGIEIFRLADEEAEAAKSDSDTKSDEGSDDDRLHRVVEALAGLNIIMSADTTADNFLAHLENVLLTVKAMSDETKNDEQVTTPAQAQLDLNKANKKPNAEVSLAARMSLHADAQHKNTVRTGLDSLLETGRCTPAEVKEHGASIAAIRLDLNEQGVHRPTAVEAFIASRQGVPAGTFWTPEQKTVRMSGEHVTEHPRMEGDAPTETEATAIVNEMFGTTPAAA